MGILNIGILAHVDAGKTSLTERILFETGVIRAIGSVDKGTTQTDTLELERSRGITIKSAVVSFQLNELKLNLIDTPGHSDFIAEVERSLRVLDAVVLIVSAVEGVQPQTRRLARAIRAAGLPLLIFVNKIDRLGARSDSVLDDIRHKLNLRVVALNWADGLGDRAARVIPHDRVDSSWREPVADLLAETSEQVIAEFERTSGELDVAFLEGELRAQIAACEVVPVFFGSAITGAGVPEVLRGIEDWLPVARQEDDAPPGGTIFKITRQPSGEKLVYLRLFNGSLSVRQRVTLQRRDVRGEIEQFEERITGLERFTKGAVTAAETVSAGDIAVLHGLKDAQIGDWLGQDLAASEIERAFPAPALESVVVPVDPAQITQLRMALEQLAEQDPLISLRQRNESGDISVRLFGEVQKEVLSETLVREYGVAVHFGPSRTICIERPTGTGEAFEEIGDPANPFYATVGLRIEPADPLGGIDFVRELGSLPLAFYRAIEETIYETLTHGLHGWDVTGCKITLTHAGFSSVLSSGGDFRKLTPLVLMRALMLAGTEVCEPVEELDVELPEDTFGAVCGALVSARATIKNAFRDGGVYRIVCQIPTVELRGIEQQLPGLTRGDGSWISIFAGYVPIDGDPPCRTRSGPDPLNRAAYLAGVARL